MRNTVLALVMLALGACGGSAASGPSPLVEVAPAVTVAPVRAFPAGLDPAYVRTLATVDASGQPKRWEGGPFHHCFSVDPSETAAAEATAQRMTELTGIPRTDSGPCNVEWISAAATGHTYTEIHGTETTIVYARVFIRVHGAYVQRDVLHEAGHVLGLNHSMRAEDLMNASPRVDAFSRDEIAMLAWMYR